MGRARVVTPGDRGSRLLTWRWHLVVSGKPRAVANDEAEAAEDQPDAAVIDAAIQLRIQAAHRVSGDRSSRPHPGRCS